LPAAVPMTEPRVTVVIVNYNGAHLLPACLAGVRAQDLPAEQFRTVVVDNASTDGSLELLAKDFPWVEVIASSMNTGFAGGNNLALREVATEYAVLLNNDAVPEPGWLSALVATLDADPDLGALASKAVFMPRFVPLIWHTPGFSPGAHDPRQLGARVYGVEVDGRDVTDKVLWEAVAFGPEGEGAGRFRWTRPEGELLVPVQDSPGALTADIKITFRVAAEAEKPLRIGAPGGVDVTGTLTEAGTEVVLALPAGTELADVVNNVGGIVLRNGYGADRGFQEVDRGQYDVPAEVFAACGNGMALRVKAGRQVGWFDDAFFMYYEDTDLCWRLRAAGWAIRYEPAAMLRHVHSATSKEWSPFWIRHVDRNRLLMLTKNATPKFAAGQVLHYPLSAASMLVRATREGVKQRSRPALRPHLLRARIMLSYLRYLPAMLARRRAIGKTATVNRSTVEKMLVESR
jgi:GT2 family glycosyltransferase